MGRNFNFQGGRECKERWMDRFRSYKARDEREFFEERKEEEIVVACSNASSFIVPPLLLFLWIVRYHAAWTMGNHRRNLFFHSSNGILRELMELDVPRCLFIFFSSFRLLLFVVRYYYIYVYIYSKLKFMEIFFFFLLYHKRTRLRSVGREISLRSRREETEKDRDGRKGFGTASCGSLFFPFFF